MIFLLMWATLKTAFTSIHPGTCFLLSSYPVYMYIFSRRFLISLLFNFYFFKSTTLFNFCSNVQTSLLFCFFFHMLQFDFCLSFEWNNNYNILYLHPCSKYPVSRPVLQQSWNRSKTGIVSNKKRLSQNSENVYDCTI